MSVGEDLGAVAHDSGIRHQPLDVGVAERGDDLGVEAVERLAEGRALAQDGRPGQPGLEGLEADPLVEPVLVAHGHAPLGVVVVAQQRVDRRPGGAGEPVIADDDAGAGHGRPVVLTVSGLSRRLTQAASAERAARMSSAMSFGSVVGA